MEDIMGKLKGMFGDDILDKGKELLGNTAKDASVSSIVEMITSENTLTDDIMKKIVDLLSNVNKVAKVKEIDEITNAVENENDPDKARSIFKELLNKAVNSDVFKTTIVPLIPQLLDIVNRAGAR